MKSVQCYELSGGLALINHAFVFVFFCYGFLIKLILENQITSITHACSPMLSALLDDQTSLYVNY